MVELSISKNTQDYIILVATILSAALSVIANAGTEITAATIGLAIIAGLNAFIDINKETTPAPAPTA